MRHLLLIAVFASNAVFAHAQASTPTKSGTAQSADHLFLRHAAEGNMAEIELGQLAQKNASSQVVKQFGQRMVIDHTNLLAQVKNVAETKGVSLPTSINAEDQGVYRTLSGKTGNAFDRAYITDMINDHVHDISEFEQAANSATDYDIRTLASQSIPIMQEHLRLAQNAARQLGISVNPAGPGQ